MTLISLTNIKKEIDLSIGQPLCLLKKLYLSALILLFWLDPWHWNYYLGVQCIELVRN